MTVFATLSAGLNTAYILFCFALGIWAGFVAVRGGTLGGQFWGAIWSCTILAGLGLLAWLARALSHESLRPVYVLYELYFIIVLPGTFALLKGRDDRSAAAIFAGVAIFSALSAISAADPSRGVIVIPPTPTPVGLLIWIGNLI